MSKLQKPKKYIIGKFSKRFPFSFVSNKVSLEYFMTWCKKEIPKSAIDVTVELCEDWDYDNCDSYLEIAWNQKTLNLNYEKDLKKYNKKVKR